MSGEVWGPGLASSPQNYVVLPDQPWLDGFSVQKGLIRQFVAMPLGEGFTAEEQLTGKAEHGGLQIQVFPMQRERYQLLRKERPWLFETTMACLSMSAAEPEMGLAPGGLMRQEIYKDPYGIGWWDRSVTARCFVHILNSDRYRAITGCRPPTEPLTAERYQEAGIPWFDYYSADATALQGAPALAQLDSVAAKTIKKGGRVKESTVSIDEGEIVQLGQRRAGGVREGKF